MCYKSYSWGIYGIQLSGTKNQENTSIDSNLANTSCFVFDLVDCDVIHHVLRSKKQKNHEPVIKWAYLDCAAHVGVPAMPVRMVRLAARGCHDIWTPSTPK